MELRDTIGKVTLDYSKYPGEDLYCDGDIEDTMLDIAKNYSKVEYPRIIEEQASWPVLYHFSKGRENIVDWLPMDKNTKVLEIGSGCGAITGALARKAGEVTCVDLSKKRSLINAYRNQDCDNVTIRVGNFADIEPELDTDYDYCLLIGVFEYGQSYIGGETPYEDFLRIIRKHTAVNGRIVIAIENKYGLKYFAGCKEDHLGSYFKGLEGYVPQDGVKTFSKNGLNRLFKSCNEKNVRFFYPYPDYKFMTSLYSDERLPLKGELYNNDRNFDRDRIKLFDEKKTFDGILEDGYFDIYSNSYLVILGDDVQTEYVRYSNDRADEYKICTEILNIHGEKIVKKRALSESGIDHIRRMRDNCDLLTDAYKDTELNICPAKVVDEGRAIIFPFIEGKTLAELMDECLNRGDNEGFEELFKEYLKRIGSAKDVPVADYDMIFSNILIKDKIWTVIDYEWVQKKKVPVKELAFRALYCFILEDEGRTILNYDSIIKSLGITVDEEQGYREQEALFQKDVTGKYKSMGELRDLIGGEILSLGDSLSRNRELADKLRIRIYLDHGAGFNEEDAYYLNETYDDAGHIKVTVEFPANTKRVRIDPCEDYALTFIESIVFNDRLLDIKDNKRLYINGKKLKDAALGGVTAVFFNNDPNIVIEVSDLVRSTGNKLEAYLDTCLIHEEMIENLSANLKRMIRL
ncbi:MAG: class I SAM-dependent methyltransferase [Lachnospiraceae bacterium]|nr:class I SAM-dependent methyltransferase [Lachnospiraceae bacterium]